jgi:hypothetical protein
MEPVVRGTIESGILSRVRVDEVMQLLAKAVVARKQHDRGVRLSVIPPKVAILLSLRTGNQCKSSATRPKARCGNNEGGRRKDEPDMKPDRILAEYRERLAKRNSDAK